MMSASPCALLREEGNKAYKAACQQGLCPVIQSDRLRQARNLYYRALDVIGNDEERCSAAKNLAQCEWRLGIIAISRQERPQLIIHQFQESLKYYQYSFLNGEKCKSAEWYQDICAKYVKCFRDAEEYISQFSFKARILHLTKLISFMSIPDISASAYLEMTRHHFHEGINAWEKGDFMSCKHQMAECHFPMNEASRLGAEMTEVQSEVRVLEADVYMHMSIAESCKARKTGDDLLTMITQERETLDMNMVWDIIDWYKQSILLAREMDMELEAIALGRIGRVYAKVLKFKVQAKEYFKRSIQMAESMHPRTFNMCDWYQECVEMMKKYQEETVSHEEEVKQKEREKVKGELEKEFKELKEKHMKMSNIEFLKYVYTRFPPKNDAFKMDGDAQDNIKKALQKAVTHYHPDKSEPEKNGLKWKVLSEEITKYLTSRYEVQKGVA